MENGVVLHLNKLELPEPKNALCLVWLKKGKMFWTRLEMLSMCFLQFHGHLHLEKSLVLHLNKLELSKPKKSLCQVWLKKVQWFWRQGSTLTVDRQPVSTRKLEGPPDVL